MIYWSLGVVGVDAIKLEKCGITIERAQGNVNLLLDAYFFGLHGTKKVTIVSGGASGIDTCAANFAARHTSFKEFKPADGHHHWSCRDDVMNPCMGFKFRNNMIAHSVNELFCFSVKQNSAFCYHCGVSGHIVNGGCYTMKLARRLNKPTTLYLL